MKIKKTCSGGLREVQRFPDNRGSLGVSISYGVTMRPGSRLWAHSYSACSTVSRKKAGPGYREAHLSTSAYVRGRGKPTGARSSTRMAGVFFRVERSFDPDIVGSMTT